MKYPVALARLDADRTGVPMTRILGRIPVGDDGTVYCDGRLARSYRVEDVNPQGRKTVRLIVSRCRKTHDRITGKDVWCASGPWLVDLTFPSLEEAMAEGEKRRGEGFSVVVRPTYNEVNAIGRRFFREWRSLDASPLEEVLFPY